MHDACLHVPNIRVFRSSVFRLRKKDEYCLATEYTFETQSGLDPRLIRYRSGKPTQLQWKRPPEANTPHWCSYTIAHEDIPFVTHTS